MRVTVVLGSPRKKDSYRIIKEIENKMNVDFEYIHLSEKNIQSCIGCDQCFQKSELACPLKDELLTIVSSLEKADGIIFTSPVYAYQVTSHMKKFIDRTSYLFHRPTLIEKPGMIVTTTDGGGGKMVYDYLKMTLTGFGLNCVGGLNIVSTRYFDERKQYDETYHKKQAKQMVKLATEFKAQLNRDRDVVTYYELFMFNCLRSKTYTSEIDKAYWLEKGWLNQMYYRDVKLSLPKVWFSKFMKRMIHQMGKKYSQ